ncbi:hypothetical protein HBN50_06445 [Halobacteriovorax sp. GB3]|uniref:hypothetical protein n=1 Tax=Halobacteriovorax sp. GB3 TaxID=2719615 RepID=UPI0023615FE6|nr:hypothetical protein [Halobacteriovorax sp. GB3]MDD0852727.1 hypothetical protein [Halobacteriovorax sp. GB3]
MSEALKLETLDSLVLTHEQIEAQDLPKENIFEIKINDSIYGPFLGKELKDHLESDTLDLSDITLRTYGQEDWSDLVSHPYFQRRRPQVLTDKDSSIQEFYLLIEGQKQGPFHEDKINELLQEKALVHTDLVSEDGQEWTKIHHYKQFDRRKLTNKSLPDATHLAEGLVESVDQNKILKMAREKTQSEEALAGLAWAHHPEDRVHMNAGPVIVEDEHSQSSETKSKLPWVILLVLSLVGILTLVIKGKDEPTQTTVNKKTTFAPPKAKQARSFKAQELKPIQAKESRSQANNIRNSRAVTRGTKAFKDSDTFKNFEKKKMMDDAYINEDTYDAEQEERSFQDDPVRSRIPKEILDPAMEPDNVLDAEFTETEQPENLEQGEVQELEGEIFNAAEEY